MPFPRSRSRRRTGQFAADARQAWTASRGRHKRVRLLGVVRICPLPRSSLPLSQVDTGALFASGPLSGGGRIAVRGRPQNRRDAHRAGFAGHHHRWLFLCMTLHIAREPTAKIRVTNVRAHRPIQRTAGLAMKDARSLIGKSGNSLEIEIDDGCIVTHQIRHLQARHDPEIEKGVLTAVLAAYALAQRASRSENPGGKASWLRRTGRDGPIPRTGAMKIPQEIDQMLTQPADAVSGHPDEPLLVPWHNDR